MTTTTATTTTTTMTTTTTAATKGGGDVRFEDLGGEPQLKPSPPMGSTTVTDPKQGGAVKILEHCELFSRKKVQPSAAEKPVDREATAWATSSLCNSHTTAEESVDLKCILDTNKN